MWSEFRQNIEQARKESSIPDTEFKPVNINTWKEIETNIFKTFCNAPKRIEWLWSCLKGEYHVTTFNYNWPFDQLCNLVDTHEKVWFFLNENDKFWFYEGYIKPIEKILEGCNYLDEIYIASKKYEWLLCINHDDMLYAVGGEMPDRLRKLEKQVDNLVVHLR
jgi:hypothetical protein